MHKPRPRSFGDPTFRRESSSPDFVAEEAMDRSIDLKAPTVSAGRSPLTRRASWMKDSRAWEVVAFLLV